jgi:ABC-type Mn2+/Zn2+ transport system ATPase subunit
MEPAFQVDNLILKFGNTLVLEQANFALSAGQITYVIGGNGAGKTTLIRALLGLHPAWSGKIFVLGQPLSQKIISDNVGYVPQHAQIDRSFPISVAEMIALECQSAGHHPVDTVEHLKAFGAEHLSNRRIRDLSGGEMQKVLIARALVTDPKILILDEPFNNLDHSTEIELINLIRELHNHRGKTVLLITHDLNIIKLSNSDCLYLTHNQAHWGKATDIIKEHKLAPI